MIDLGSLPCCLAFLAFGGPGRRRGVAQELEEGGKQTQTWPYWSGPWRLIDKGRLQESRQVP